MWILGKVIMAISAYTAGSILASSLDPKKKKKIKKIKEENWDVLAFLINDFIDTHKKLFESAKEEILSEENKKLFEQKKEELIKLAWEFKKQAEETINDLKEKWKDKAIEWLQKIEEIYEEQKEKLNELKEIAPDKAWELKEKILAWAKEIKEELKNKISKK